MAEGDSGAATAVSYDLKQLLGTGARDFLVNSNGDKVNIEDHLKGKTVGIYFSAHWCGPCRRFTPSLAEVYAEVNAAEGGGQFEIVFVSRDRDEKSFKDYLSEMPWLAVPFSDGHARDGLKQQFEVHGIPHLVVLKAVDHGSTTATVVNNDAVAVVLEYGVEAYPFSEEKVNQLKAAEERRKRESQTLESILVHGDLDYVLGKDGARVPVRDLVGKTVLIYFSAHWCPPCRSFTPRLAEVYKELQAQGKPVEIVFASSDEDEESFNDYFGSMPWLALPLSDPREKALSKLFKVRGIPTLVALEPSGKTAIVDARGLVEEHGAAAYPFTESRASELEALGDVEGGEITLEAEGEKQDGIVCEGDVCRRA